MSESLSFRQVYSYELQKIGIAIPVRLDFGGRFVEFKAKVVNSTQMRANRFL